MKALLGIIITLLYTGSFVDAQSISGPTTAVVGDELTYSVSNGVVYMASNWIPVNGTVVTKWNVGTTYYAKIQWLNPGTITLEFRDQNYTLQGSKAITISIGAPATTFITTQNCNSTTITRNTSPGAGVIWYWQVSATGTSTTLGSSSTIVRTTTGAIYLRALAGSTWSPTSQNAGTVTIVTSTAVPASAVNGNAISNVVIANPISVTTVSGATSYRWYTDALGGAPIGGVSTNNYVPQVLVTKTFYVEAVTGNCASTSRRMVIAYVHPEPIVTASNGGQLSGGGTVALSVNNYAYDSYQWLDANSTPITQEATSMTGFNATTTGLYKVRVKKGMIYFVSPGSLVSSHNFIVSNNILVEGVFTESSIPSLPIGSRSQTAQFVDGLGRAIETVIMQGSPGGKDIVQAIAYDPLSRENIKYLPYVSSESNGVYKTDALGTPGNYTTSAQFQFYNGGAPVDVATDAKPFSEIRFMPDPLGRPLKQGAPGAAWQPDANDSYTSADHTVKMAYEKNTAGEVTRWVYTPPTASTSIALNTNGTYPSDQLFKSKTKNEQGNEVIEYKNVEGQVMLKKVHAGGGVWAQTYYIYDVIGNLVVVLPPEAVLALTN